MTRIQSMRIFSWPVKSDPSVPADRRFGGPSRNVSPNWKPLWRSTCMPPPPACTGKFFFDRAEAPEHKTLAGTESKSKEIKQLWEFCEAKTASLGRVDLAAASSAAATSAAATSADATSAAA